MKIEIPTTPHRMTIRAGIKFFSEHTFAIPAPIVNDYFIEYKLIYWSGYYLIKAMSQEKGYISRGHTKYKVIYNTGFKGVKDPDKQYAISFRIPKDDWNLEPVAIISNVH